MALVIHYIQHVIYSDINHGTANCLRSRQGVLILRNLCDVAIERESAFFHDPPSSELYNSVVELDDEDSVHGLAVDAFYMSFHAQEGRLSLLGANEIHNGTHPNWADRLLAMLEAGDFVEAIRLASSYYCGHGEKETIGLPEDDRSRHEVVREMLLELMEASLRYAFGQNQQLEDFQLTALATACVDATLDMGDGQFLFDEVFTSYDDHEKAAILLDILEPYIRNGQIASIPPTVLKPLIHHYITRRSPTDLEKVICCLDVSTIDIDHITDICKTHHLYDAYLYVWTRALGDYISPIEELLKLSHSPSKPNGHAKDIERNQRDAAKVFPYLSSTLTGRVYPTGREEDFEESEKAKDQIYEFLFSSALDRTAKSSPNEALTQSFPQLRELLSFDTASSMRVLNEAFEDSYLNRSDEFQSDVEENGVFAASTRSSTTYTRQFIVNVLLEVMSSTSSKTNNSIFLDMFVARNVAKFPQDIVLSGSTLNHILKKLCDVHDVGIADECQLSVEYLLSVHHPPDLQSFLPLFQKAKFFRVLKNVYRSENQWPLLVRTYFLDDDERHGVFEAVRACLSEYTAASSQQQQQVLDILRAHARDLAEIDVADTAALVADLLPESHGSFLSTLEGDQSLEYRYLSSLLQPQGTSTAVASSDASLVGRYIQLMCQQDPPHVAGYVNSLADVDLHLDDILPAMEASETTDAAVILMARQGRVQDGMNRLVRKLNAVEAAFSETLANTKQDPSASSAEEAISAFLGAIKKYSGVGIWLCRRQTKLGNRSRPMTRPVRKSDSITPILSFEEKLWLQLIHSVVSTARTFFLPESADQAGGVTALEQRREIAASLRAVAQDVFTALLQATTTSRADGGDRNDISFLQILRAFLSDAAASLPSLAELRSVIRSIFSAYAYEENLLALANSMLEKDLFVQVDEIAKLRSRGWRPRGQVCEICRRRVWGPGASAQIWEAWSTKEQQSLQEMKDREHDVVDENMTALLGKGKATAETFSAASSQAGSANGREGSDEAKVGPAVVFACRHIFHQVCLNQQSVKTSARAAVTPGIGAEPLSSRGFQEAGCPTCSIGI